MDSYSLIANCPRYHASSRAPIGSFVTPIELLMEGNSMTVGLHSKVNPLLTSQYGAGRFNTTNFATSGEATDTMLTDLPTGVLPAVVAGKTIATIWTIVNDLYLSSITARDAVDDLWSWCDQVTAAGSVVIVVTPTPRTNSGTPVDYESRRQTALGFIRDEWQSHCAAVLDIAADSRFQDSTNTTYFTDGVHMTSLGYDIVALGIKKCIDHVIAGAPNGAPAFDTQPSSGTHHDPGSGVAVPLSGYAVGEGTQAVTYQWQRLIAAVWTDVVGQTNPTYTPTLAVADDGAQFRCNATNRHGTTTSNTATITVTAGASSPDTIASCLAFFRSDQSVFVERTGASATTASTDGTAVGTWRSVTGSRFKTAAASGEEPSLVTDQLNGMPIVRFDGSNDRIRGDAAISNARTMFALVKFRAAFFVNSEGAVTSTQNAETGLSVAGHTSGTNLADAMIGSATVRRNAVAVPSVNVPGPMNEWVLYILRDSGPRSYTWQMGGDRNAGRYGAYDIACVGLYSTSLSDTDCQDIETWVEDTYGLSF